MFIKVKQIGYAGEYLWSTPLEARYNILNVRSYCPIKEYSGKTSIKISVPSGSKEIIVDHTPEEVDLMIEKANKKTMKILFDASNE